MRDIVNFLLDKSDFNQENFCGSFDMVIQFPTI